MEKRRVNSLSSGSILLAAVCIGILLISGCATTPQKAEGPIATLDVCSTAEITTLKYFMKAPAYGGDPKLHIKVGLKNISDKSKRFNMNIALPEGPSSGGYYPKQIKKGKIPSLKPGETLVRTFRIYYDKVPEQVTIKVEEA